MLTKPSLFEQIHHLLKGSYLCTEQLELRVLVAVGFSTVNRPHVFFGILGNSVVLPTCHCSLGLEVV